MTTTTTDDTARFDAATLAYLHAHAYVMAHKSNLLAAKAAGDECAWHIIMDWHTLLYGYAVKRGEEMARKRLVDNVQIWESQHANS